MPMTRMVKVGTKPGLHESIATAARLEKSETLDLRGQNIHSRNLPELLVDARVSVVNCEFEQRRRDGDVLEDGDALLVWTEHRSVVIGVGDTQFYVSDVDVRHVRVLDVHRQVERWIQQRVIVHRLHTHRTSLDVFHAD